MMSASQFSPASGVMNPCGSSRQVSSLASSSRRVSRARTKKSRLSVSGWARALFATSLTIATLVAMSSVSTSSRSGQIRETATMLLMLVVSPSTYSVGWSTRPIRLSPVASHQETSEEPAVRLQGFKDPLHFPFPNSGPLKDRIALGVLRFHRVGNVPLATNRSTVPSRVRVPVCAWSDVM